mgnify:CR=1 FL=1
MRVSLGSGSRPTPLFAAGLLGMVCCAALAAEPAQLLQEWPIAGRQLPANLFFWHRDTPDIEAEAEADPGAGYPGGLGVCSVHIARSPRVGAADIQLCPLARLSLGRGGVYEISLWARASEDLTVETAGRVAIVSLNRPPVNALSYQTFDEIAAVMEELSSERSASAIVLRSQISGTKAETPSSVPFCSAHSNRSGRTSAT